MTSWPPGDVDLRHPKAPLRELGDVTICTVKTQNGRLAPFVMNDGIKGCGKLRQAKKRMKLNELWLVLLLAFVVLILARVFSCFFLVSLLLLWCLECGFVKITDDPTCFRYCWPAPNAPHRALWFPAIAVAVIEGTKAATSINWLEEGLRPHHWINSITLAEQIWYKEITKGANAMITQMCDIYIMPHKKY